MMLLSIHPGVTPLWVNAALNTTAASHGERRLRRARGQAAGRPGWLVPGTSLHQPAPAPVRGHPRHPLDGFDMTLRDLRRKHGDAADTTALTGAHHRPMRKAEPANAHLARKHDVAGDIVSNQGRRTLGSMAPSADGGISRSNCVPRAMAPGASAEPVGRSH